MASIIIYDKVIEYEKVHRRIKNPRLEFKINRLQLILPLGYKDENMLIQKYRKWIYKKAILVDELTQVGEKLFLNHSINLARFKREVREMIRLYVEELHLRVPQVNFRKMRARWGSCDCRGTITINTYLRFLPELYIRYITYHEVVHLKYYLHGKRFNGVVKRKFPECKNIEKLLCVYGIMLRKHLVEKGLRTV